MRVVWTRHAEERQKEWERKKGITKLEVENLLKKPGQIVPGDLDTLIAQSKKYNGLMRVAFKETGDAKKILTVYWTSKAEKYWREEK